jgi:SPX domain protein involved in polyphosphate accumulation
MISVTQLYNERLSKSTTSVSVRIRWFNDSRKHVYVERQTQDAVTSATGTARERFSLPEKYVRPNASSDGEWRGL